MSRFYGSLCISVDNKMLKPATFATIFCKVVYVHIYSDMAHFAIGALKILLWLNGRNHHHHNLFTALFLGPPG